MHPAAARLICIKPNDQTQSLPACGVSTPLVGRSSLSMGRRSLCASHAARSIPLCGSSQACMRVVCGAVCAGTLVWLDDSVCARTCATMADVAMATNSRHSALLILMVKFSLVDGWPALCIDRALLKPLRVARGSSIAFEQYPCLSAIYARGLHSRPQRCNAGIRLEAITRRNGKDDTHAWRSGMTSAQQLASHA